MIRKLIFFLSIFSLGFFGAFFFRGYFQMTSPEKPYFATGISSPLVVSKGDRVYVNGIRARDGECFEASGQCLCLKTTPSLWERVFNRPLFSLPPVFSAGPGEDSLINIRVEGCHEVFQVRKGREIKIRGCREGVLIQGCRRSIMRPGVFYALKVGDVALFPSLGFRVRIVEFSGNVPARRGGKVRVYQIRRRELVVEEEVEGPIFQAYLLDDFRLPLKKGTSLYHPIGETLPFLPPFFYPSQREAFISVYLREGDYILKDGKYLARGSGYAVRAGKITGDWANFKREIEALNRILGDQVYSKMPCWNGKTLAGLRWYYSFSPPSGWKTSLSPWGWERAHVREGWICGKLWSPHFSGERTVYFRARIKGPGEVFLNPPPNGIFFLDGEVCGRERKILGEGGHILSLMLRVKGAGKPDGKIRVNPDLSLSMEGSGVRSVFPEKQKLIINFSPAGVGFVKFLQGPYKGLVIGIPGGVYIFYEPEFVSIKIDSRNELIPLKETRTGDYSLERLHYPFALGDAVILKNGRVWVLRARGKVSGPGSSFLSFRDGKYHWGGREMDEGETFSVGDSLVLAGGGDPGDEGAFLPVVSYIKPAFRKGRVKLTISPALQRLSFSVLSEEINNIRRREKKRAGELDGKVRALEEKLRRAWGEYRKKRNRTSALAVLDLEQKLTQEKYRLWKIRNPFYEGAIVLMDGEGRLLASASYPADKLNRGWGETYNVGSTFKLVDSVAILSSSSPYIRKLLRRFPFAGPGSENLRGKRLLTGIPINFDLRNFRGERIPYGVDFQTAFAHSFNVYFAYLAMHLYPPLLRGKEQVILPLSRLREEFPLLKYAEDLGFNRRFELTPSPGTVLTARSVFPVNAYKLSEIAHYSIGQAGLRATPLQMALVALAVARGGVFVPPRLVEEISSGNFRAKFKAERKRVFSRRVALEIEEAMGMVVKEGTARGAFSGWKWPWRVFAKTGTAETSLYKDNSLFVGYMKKGERVLVFSVVIPRSGIGGRVAGRVARRLLDLYIKYLERGK